MNSLSRPRDSTGPWLIAAVLCVLAIAAVLITAPAVLKAWRHNGASGAEPLAPKLAALTDRQLAELLPKQSDFPPSWTVTNIAEQSDAFGYFRYHVSDEGLGFNPAECFSVVGVASTGAFDGAEVFGHDASDPAEVADRRDIRLRVGREFDPAGFDAFTGLVNRCLRFSSSAIGSYSVRILEDSRPAGAPQRFRYSITRTIGEDPLPDDTRIDYYSYARTSGLILTGTASSGHEQPFDALFDSTLHRISNR
jgi:hypothetical protein